MKIDYKFDIDLIGNKGWSEFHTDESFTSSEKLITFWVKKYLDEVDNRKAGKQNLIY